MTCEGRRRRWKGRYHRFACDGLDIYDRELTLRVTALSRYRFRVVEIACYDDNANDYCP